MGTLIRTLRHAALPALAALAVALAGCVNPFRPATPEAPTSTTVKEDFSTPEHLLATLVSAMEDKGTAGRLAWANAMADSSGPNTRAFYAFMDPVVLSDWGQTSGIDAPVWDLDLERQFYDRFGALTSGAYQMTFSADNFSPSDDIGTETALLHRHYFVYSIEQDLATPIAQGYVDLYMVYYDGRWWVVRWQDRLDPDVGVNPSDGTSYSLGRRRLDSLAQS